MVDCSRQESLRSPRNTLGGYILLPRLIDKIRLHAKENLPKEYAGNLLKPGLTLDGRFLSFTGLDGEALRGIVLSSDTDEAILAWIEKNARYHTEKEKHEWARSIDSYRADAALTQYRKEIYPEMASQIEVGDISVLDLIDLDEGRIPISKWIDGHERRE